MKRDLKEITLRRTAAGDVHRQDAEQLATAEADGWTEYDRQGRPEASPNGGWVARLKRPADYDDMTEAPASEDLAEPDHEPEADASH